MTTYLFEVSFSWLLFYLAYVLFLQEERFFGINRGYLLVALIGGLLLPFLQIETSNTYLTQLPILLDEITVGVRQNIEVTGENQSWTFTDLLLSIYLIGVLIGVFRFSLSIQKLYVLYKEGIVEHNAFYSLVKTNSMHSPFSFGHYLFISDNVPLNEKEYQYIIEHEVTHIRQKHTIDLLLVEVLSILFWFNPLVFLYRTALRDQHEFLADKAVLNHVPVKEYGQLLIEQSIPGLKIGLVNHLIYSQLKKRINMMTKKKQSNKTPFLRYALSFSAFLLVFWTVSCDKDITAEEQEKVTQELLTEKLTANKSPKELEKGTLTVAEKMPRFPGCEQNAGDEKSKKACADQMLLKFIYDNIKYPKKAKEDGTEGMSVVRFVVTTTGTLKDLAIVRSVSPECDAEVIRVIELMKEQEIVWTPGEQDGKLVNVTYNLPVRFKLQ